MPCAPSQNSSGGAAERVWTLLFEPSSCRVAAAVAAVSAIMVVVSVTAAVVQSYPAFRAAEAASGVMAAPFVAVEAVCGVGFLLEYLARVGLSIAAWLGVGSPHSSRQAVVPSSPWLQRRHYLLSPWHAVDAVAAMPFVALVATHGAASGDGVLPLMHVCQVRCLSSARSHG